MSFAHDTVDQKIQYRNGYPVEIMGTQNPRFRYTIPADENLIRGGFPNFFTKTLPELIMALYDTSPGVLNDPLRGVFTCKPVQYDEQLDAKLRSGVSAEVEFTRHVEPTEDSDLDLASLPSAESQAGILDQEVVRSSLYEGDPPSLAVDPFRQIAGYGQQLVFAGNKIAAMLDRAASGAEAIELAAQALEKPDGCGVIRAARRLRLASYRLKSRGTTPGKTIRRVKKNADMTLSAIAADVGMSLDDLLKLNPWLATAPLVKAGTPVNYWATV
jgi:hypothetical protein